jgi:hypothetical protein
MCKNNKKCMTILPALKNYTLDSEVYYYYFNITNKVIFTGAYYAAHD